MNLKEAKRLIKEVIGNSLFHIGEEVIVPTGQHGIITDINIPHNPLYIRPDANSATVWFGKSVQLHEDSGAHFSSATYRLNELNHVTNTVYHRALDLLMKEFNISAFNIDQAVRNIMRIDRIMLTLKSGDSLYEVGNYQDVFEIHVDEIISETEGLIKGTEFNRTNAVSSECSVLNLYTLDEVDNNLTKNYDI